MLPLINAIYSFTFAYGLLGFVYGRLSLFGKNGPLIVSEKGWIFAWLVCVSVYLLFDLYPRYRSGRKDREISDVSHSYLKSLQANPLTLNLNFCMLSLVILIFSDFIYRNYIFYTDSAFLADIVYSGLGLLLICLLVSYRQAKISSVVTFPWLIFSQVVLVILFLSYADGRFIISDDNPSFLYRLQLLKEHFPKIPFYNIEWNAGYYTSEFFATGVLNVFLLSAPFIYFSKNFGSLEGAYLYTFLIVYIFILVVPWAVYYACRILGLAKQSAVLSGVLAIVPTLELFRWVMKYGTIGFGLSAGFLALALALSCKIFFTQEKWKKGELLILLFACTICVAWPMAIFFFVPLVVFLLWGLLPKTKLQTNLKYLVVFAFLFFLVNGPWMFSLLQSPKVKEIISSSVLYGSSTSGGFDSHHHQESKLKEIQAKENSSLDTFTIGKQISDYNFELNIGRLMSDFRNLMVGVNPILIFLFIPGLLLIPSKTSRWLFGSTIIWLLVVAEIGDQLKPQLEFRRFTVVAAYLMACVAGVGLNTIVSEALNRLWEKGDWRLYPTKLLNGLVLVVVFGTFFITPISVGAMFLNRSPEKYRFADECADHLAYAIKEFGGEGRTVFGEFILHEWCSSVFGFQNGGHIAPLATFSGKPLYAVDFYHTRWGWVNSIPKQFRGRGPAGVEEYLDTINSTALITMSPQWANHAKGLKNKYQFVYHQCRTEQSSDADSPEPCFRMFSRKGPENGYFLSGSGYLKPSKEGFIVSAKTKDLVLKYRYLPELKVFPNDAAEIFPVHVFDEEISKKGETKPFHFIGLKVKKRYLNKDIKIGLHKN